MRIVAFFPQKKKWANVLFWLYLLALLRLTVFRPGFSMDHLMGGTINLHLWNAYGWWARHGHWWAFYYDLIGNLVCFVPFGGYLAWKRRNWPLWKIGAAGLALSFAVEAAQYVFAVGFSDIDDLIVNTLGVLLGAWFARLLKV